MKGEASFDSILRVTTHEGEWFEMIVVDWHVGQLADMSWVRAYRGVISNCCQAYASLKGTLTSVNYPNADYKVVCVG